MAADNTHPGHRADCSRVDIAVAEEPRSWAQHFHTTEDNVRAAVSEVGSEVDAVGDFPQRGRKPPQHPSAHRPPQT